MRRAFIIITFVVGFGLIGLVGYVKLNTIETAPALPQEIVEGTHKCVPPYKCLPQNNE